jgi:hypothetical protein
MGCLRLGVPTRDLAAEDDGQGCRLGCCGGYSWAIFLVVEITPPALQNIGYKTYVIFAVPDTANADIVWCCYPETGGQPLEAIDRLFVEDEFVDTSGLTHPS